MDRYSHPDTLGLMIVIPGLTADGEQAARAIMNNDDRFLYFPAHEIVLRLRSEGYISELPTGRSISDPIIIVSEEGIYSACMELDDYTRAPVGVWPGPSNRRCRNQRSFCWRSTSGRRGYKLQT